MTKISPLWVRSPSGKVLHRKREYGAKSKTLCGLHVSAKWDHSSASLHKCLRCKA